MLHLLNVPALPAVYLCAISVGCSHLLGSFIHFGVALSARAPPLSRLKRRFSISANVTGKVPCAMKLAFFKYPSTIR